MNGRTKKLSLVGALGALLMAVWMMTGCSSFRPLITDVEFVPTTISPNADGKDDVTHIFYRLSRNADFTAYFTDRKGQRFYLRKNRRRSAGKYDFFWGGVIPTHERFTTKYFDGLALDKVLPDGVYTYTFEAVDDGGHRGVVQGQIEIRNADTVLPELREFTLSQKIFSPNQDGIDDRVGITYYLNKKASRVRVYLLGPDGTEYPIEEKERNIPSGEPGIHYYDYDAGIDKRAEPPPDGTYTVVGEVTDLVGNHTMITRTLTITEGGVPRADILNGVVDFSAKVVPLGGKLVFTSTVENIGKVPIRTSGPPPGTVYHIGENFNTLAKRSGDTSWYEQPGVWRFGINFETNAGIPYPFRFAVGREQDLEKRVIDGKTYYYLLPGHRGLVTGTIIIDEKQPRNPVYFWGGLIHEDVGIESFNNYVDAHSISIGVP